ncbi:hypothetical protein, partial [Inquilinus sp. CA228]|uniref:hypothetical protein n=1 Tax=Inquilinus sp. CA228 TaxID=3455609 RepID=UPI003F8D5619
MRDIGLSVAIEIAGAIAVVAAILVSKITGGVRDRLEIADGGFLGERGYDSSYGCGRNRAVAGWPRSQRRPSAI